MLSQSAASRREGYFRREWHWAVDRAHTMDESIPFILPVVIDDLGSGHSGIPHRFWEIQGCRFPAGHPTPEFVERVRQIIRRLRLWQPGSP